jgi:hypothetical protein
VILDAATLGDETFQLAALTAVLDER